MTTPMEVLLGSELVQSGGKTVKTADELGSADVVGIYFSAHWCPPCRGFTPVLAELVKEAREMGLAFSVVFASSDSDQKEFDDYLAEMPWSAVPFKNRDIKAKLSKKYKVSGIPTLVLVDANTGEVIDKNGRSAVQDLSAFPWRPPSVADILETATLIRCGNDGISAGGKNASNTTTIKDVQSSGSRVLLYFSAHWCPPCRRFTPELVSFYNKAKEAGKKVEVIFISSDRNEDDYQEYTAEMPWLAVSMHNTGVKKKLSAACEVEGIPTLVLLDSELNIETTDARSFVDKDDAVESFPDGWVPPLVMDVEDDPSRLNDDLCVVALMEEAPKAQDDIISALTEVATEEKEAGTDVAFYHSSENSGRITPQIRKLLGLNPRAKAGEIQLVLMDLGEDRWFEPSGGSLVAGVTADDVRALLKAYRAGELEAQAPNK